MKTGDRIHRANSENNDPVLNRQSERKRQQGQNEKGDPRKQWEFLQTDDDDEPSINRIQVGILFCLPVAVSPLSYVFTYSNR